MVSKFLGRPRDIQQILSKGRLSPTAQEKVLLFFTLAMTVSAMLWQLMINPLTHRLSNDFSYSASLISTNNFYDSSHGYQGALTSENKLTYTTEKANGNSLTIKASIKARNSAEGLFTQTINRTYLVDKRNSKHIPNKSNQRQGYLFAPHNLAKQDFVYWHVSFDAPAHMKYSGTEDILGLQTYRYETRYLADQTKEFTALPEIGETKGLRSDVTLKLWVEPTTGHLVKYEDRATTYFYDLTTKALLDPWQQSSNKNTFESIASQVKAVNARKTIQGLSSVWVPFVLWAIALTLLLIWLAIMWARHWRPKDPQNAIIRTLAISIGTVGAFILTGWVAGDRLQMHINTQFISPHPLTALSLIVFAIGILLLEPARKSKLVRISASVLLCPILASAVLFFINYGTGLPLAIDILLKNLDLPPVDKISPITEISFLLISLAMLILLWWDKIAGRRIAAIMLGISLFFALTATMGYVFSPGLLNSLPWFKSISLVSTLAILVLNITIYATHPHWAVVRRILNASPSLLVASLVGIIALLATGVGRQQIISSNNRQANIQFQSDTNGIQEIISHEFTSYINALRGSEALFVASEEVNRREWRAQVDTLQLSENYPGMLGLGFAQMVSPAEKAAHELAIRKEGFPNYKIVPEGNRSQYSSVIYLEPFAAQNQRALGYDMFSNPTQREAMEHARDTGRPAISHRVALTQESSQDVQIGLLIYMPVYKNGLPHSTIEERRVALAGFVYTPLQMTNFMQAINEQSSGLNVELFDTSDSAAATKDNRLFAADSSKVIEDRNYVPAHASTRSITVADNEFILRYSSLPGYESGISEALSTVALYGGVGASLLLTGFVFMLSSSRDRARKLAKLMTKDLREERNRAIETQQKNQAILSSIGDGVIVVDAQGFVVLFNTAAQKASKFPAESIVGHHYSKYLKFYNEKTRRDLVDPLAQALDKKISKSPQYVLLGKQNRTLLPIALKATPVLDKSKRVFGAVVIFRDVSREKQLEKAKEEFLNIASHELRTPMGAIRAYISMILGGDYGPINKDLRDPLIDVKTSTIRLIDLVNDLLSVNRLENGRTQIRLGSLEVHSILAEVEMDLKPLCREKGLSLSMTAKEEIIVQADNTMLKGVLTNLAGNAVKFTKQGKIKISVHKDKDMAIFEVADTGIGIRQQDWPKLFGKFQQVNSQEEGKPPGTGLGLYISRMVIEKLGGKLWIKSSVIKKGTTFAFSIPLAGTHQAKEIKQTLEREKEKQ